jgi:uncharacterized NAD-dependent epimerase/dehydratase family protein
MNKQINAIVYCEKAFETPYGKTTHGLVRFTRRYKIIAVVDSTCAGNDAGHVLDGKANGIPIAASIETAVKKANAEGNIITHMIIGIATDGGYLGSDAKEAIKTAINLGLNIDSGLHHFLSEDEELSRLAALKHVTLRDIRKPPPRNQLHFFSGKIEEVTAIKIAVLGTDSTIGKRTTSWLLVQALEAAGYNTAMIGTGQTAWLQGANYSLMLDSLVNDFVAGEIEHAVWSAWQETHPKVIVMEGQGSLMNPAYPGGFELLAAGRPDLVILQHAPARQDYDGFPGYRIQPLNQQIQVIELLSGKPVIAITINHENLPQESILEECNNIEQLTGLPTFDVLENGAEGLVAVLTKSAKFDTISR